MNKVIAIGELLWDCFDNRRTAAGAPYNFARHAKLCGLDPFFISAVGNDPDGESLKAEVEKAGIKSYIQVSDKYPTGYARVFSEGGNNRFELGTPAAWDDISLTQENIDWLWPYRYICYGSLAQRNEVTRNTLQQLVEKTQFKRIFDINLRPPFDDVDETATTLIWNLEHCDILKISSEDLEILKEFRQFSELDDVMDFLLHTTPVSIILETLGEDGARYHDKKGKSIFCPAPEVDAESTVGAGDAFLAAFIAGMIDGKEPEKSLKHAVHYAAQVIANQ
ncbi:MAG: hypothetical protein IJU23_10215 [Proteobacteria bacterium]|nr:hypothetical protein [Pseudomonadota bacterium]